MDTTPIPPAPTPVPPAPQPVVSVMPRRRMNPAAVAGIIIVAALVGYGAYAYFTDSWPFAPAEPMASESPSPSATPDPTTGWKTYTNTQYGFSFEYPNGWYIYQRPGEQRIYIQTVPGEVDRSTAPADFERIWISWDPQEVSTVNALWTDATGRQYTITLASELPPQNEQNMRLIADKIIPTFKFTTPVSTAGWKTYTNAQYGFEVKLPPSWDRYLTTATSFATDNGTTIPGISFATPCQSEPFAHFTIDIWPIAEYERVKARVATEGGPFPPVEIGRSNTSVYTRTHGQDGCPSAAWVAADADYLRVLSTFKFTDPTAGWKTYTFAGLGFTVKLPDSWTSRETANTAYFAPKDASDSNAYVEFVTGPTIDDAAAVLKQRFEAPINRNLNPTTSITELDEDNIRFGRIARRITTSFRSAAGVQITSTGWAVQSQTGFLLVATHYSSSDVADDAGAQENNAVLLSIRSTSPAQ